VVSVIGYILPRPILLGTCPLFLLLQIMKAFEARCMELTEGGNQMDGGGCQAKAAGARGAYGAM